MRAYPPGARRIELRVGLGGGKTESRDHFIRGGGSEVDTIRRGSIHARMLLSQRNDLGNNVSRGRLNVGTTHRVDFQNVSRTRFGQGVQRGEGKAKKVAVLQSLSSEGYITHRALKGARGQNSQMGKGLYVRK